MACATRGGMCVSMDSVPVPSVSIGTPQTANAPLPGATTSPLFATCAVKLGVAHACPVLICLMTRGSREREDAPAITSRAIVLVPHRQCEEGGGGQGDRTEKLSE